MSSGEMNAAKRRAICLADMSARRRGGEESPTWGMVSDVDDAMDTLGISCR
jgi:hypothetical protein